MCPQFASIPKTRGPLKFVQDSLRIFYCNPKLYAVIKETLLNISLYLRLTLFGKHMHMQMQTVKTLLVCNILCQYLVGLIK